jgi:hypothetical protein
MEALRGEYIQRLTQYKGNAVFDSDLEKVTTERDQLFLAKISLDREVFELKKDLKYTRHMKTECEAHLKILQLKLQDSNDKRGSPKRAINKGEFSIHSNNYSPSKKRF